MTRKAGTVRVSITLSASEDTAIAALVEYMQAVHVREQSQANDAVLAMHGDVTAARNVLDRFVDLSRDGIIASSSPSGMQVLIATARLVAAMLKQPDEKLSAALGLQKARKNNAQRMLDRVLYFGVDHARSYNGEWRTLEKSSSLVSDAAARMPEVFRKRHVAWAPTADAVLKIFQRIDQADPMGFGVIARLE